MFLLALGLLCPTHPLHAQTVLVGGINSVATPVQIAAPGTPVQSAAPDSIVQVVADAQGLPSLSPEQALAHGGSFCYWWVVPGGAYCPMPFLPQDASAVFLMADNQFLVDESGGQIIANTRRSGGPPTRDMVASTLATQADWLVGLITQVQSMAVNQQLRTTMRAMGMDLPSLPGDGGFGDGGDGFGSTGGTVATFDHTQLWLEFTNVNMPAGWTGVNLHNATNLVYAIKSTTNVATPCAGWQIETEVWPTDTNCMTFSLATLNRQNLYLRAMDWTGVTENGNTVPDWWLWKYFGTTALFDTNLDSQGNPLVSDFTNGFDPNVISFTVSATNLYVNQTTVPLQFNVTAGVANYFAVLVNGQTTTNWLPFTTPNLPVNLGTTDGVYVVSVGLRGLPADATQTWASLALTLDTTPPALTLTNLPALTGSRPFIDPAGYVNKALSSLNYTVVDANGMTTSGSGLVVAQGLNLTDPDHVTNSFQCVDLALALGVNQISIQAVDWAGNVAVTNFNYLFDTNGDSTAPAINLTWPPSGTRVSGDSFTIQGTLDDDTATASLQYTDTNGILQTIAGQVERGGNLWFENVPLVAGTNNFSLTTTDAAGNMSTTNLNNVVQSDLSLTISPLSGDAMNYALATVTGMVSDPDALISVNGVPGENDEGYWEVDNVPLPPGGTVTLLATAQPETGPASQTLLEQDRSPVVFTQKYGYTLDFSMLDWTWDATNGVEVHHVSMQWERGIGGTNLDIDTSVDYMSGGVSSNVTLTIWPADNGYLPSLPAQQIYCQYWSNEFGAYTQTYTNTLTGPPSVEWMEQSSSSGSCPGDFGVVYSEWSGREVRLFTGGGKAFRQQQSLFDLSTVLNIEQSPNPEVPDWSFFFNGLNFCPFLLTGPNSVPLSQIILGTVGNQGNDGNLWTMQPNSVELAITPTVAGGSADGTSSAFLAKASPPATSAASAINANGSLPAAPQYQLIHLTEHPALTDTNRATLNLGVGEEVDLSGMPDNTTWTFSAGWLSDIDGGRATFHAPNNATKATVTAKVKKQSVRIDFDVKEPSGVDHTIITSTHTNDYANGLAGVLMSINVYIAPTFVSFYQVRIMEVGEDATNNSGYWAYNVAPNYYSTNDLHHSADEWTTPLNDDNSLPLGDTCGTLPLLPPWGSGGESAWNIPAKWKVGDDGTTNDLQNWSNQTFSMNTNGTVSVSKFGNHVTRTTNNIVILSQ